MFAVRNRLQRLENTQIAATVFGRSSAAAAFAIGGPNELPEGGEGGGGGWPGEFPGELIPSELPIDQLVIQRVAEVERASLRSRRGWARRSNGSRLSCRSAPSAAVPDAGRVGTTWTVRRFR